ncbi:MAG: hypothetical protein Q7J65_03365 [Candidatus Marinimicrobia bacterium]|nr:hypothetical protein [Candidatus Neomarinimicrobiota bacterium]
MGERPDGIGKVVTDGQKPILKVEGAVAQLGERPDGIGKVVTDGQKPILKVAGL